MSIDIDNWIEGLAMPEQAALLRTHTPQRNSPARADMLAARRLEQLSRRPSRVWCDSPAAINRRTGKPHEHNRAKARRLAFVAKHAPLGALLLAARSWLA